MDNLFFLISTIMSIGATEIILNGEKVGWKLDLGPIGNRVTGIVCLLLFVFYVFYYLYVENKSKIRKIHFLSLYIFFLFYFLSLITRVIVYVYNIPIVYLYTMLLVTIIMQIIIIKQIIIHTDNSNDTT